MINEEKTFKKFGYYSTDLSYGSEKRIIAICDNCRGERILVFKAYKNLCRSCAQKGRKHTKETKKKISNSNLGRRSPMYNKKFSKEHKEKISKANLGKKFSEKSKGRMSISSTGKIHTQKTKEKMSKVRKGKDNPMYGKTHSRETKQKISKSQRGEMGPNWRGGISYLPYCSKFNNNLRENIRKRDNYICQLCGKIQKNRRFSVHHIHYDKVNFKREYWEQYFMRKLCYGKKIVQIYSIENELNIWNYGEF